MPPPRLLPDLQPKIRPELNTDVLRGVAAIREYLGLETDQQVYRLVQRNKKRPGSAPPIFHDGTGLVARKSSIQAWYDRQEQAVCQPPESK